MGDWLLVAAAHSENDACHLDLGAAGWDNHMDHRAIGHLLCRLAGRLVAPRHSRCRHLVAAVVVGPHPVAQLASRPLFGHQ